LLKKIIIVLLFALFVSLTYNIWITKKENITLQNTENPLQAQNSPATVITLEDMDYRNKMRQFIMNIASHGKEQNGDFTVITNNGTEIYRMLPEDPPGLYEQFLAAVDGICIEEFYFGMDMEDNSPTSVETQEYFMENLALPRQAGATIFNIDYCEGKNIDKSYELSLELGFISFATKQRDLTTIPSSINKYASENNDNIEGIADAKNFLIILNPEEFNNKEEFINSLAKTNYDVLIIDLFFYDDALTAEDVQVLKEKKNGGTRKVISYMSIGEAEDYRYYWKSTWANQQPEWIEAENQDWLGCYKVRYWDKDWQSIIYGKEDSYLDSIIRAGFDGVFLDVIDAYTYFEES